MIGEKSIILVIVLINFVLSEDCSSKVPTNDKDCLSVVVDKGKQCCTKTTRVALAQYECVLLTDEDALDRTTKVYTGTEYKCPGTTTTNSTTTNTATANTTIISTPSQINDINIFQRSCAAKYNPASNDDCLGFKYDKSNLCCRITYLPFVTSSSRTYCMYYTKQEADDIINLGSKYYSYHCSSLYIGKFVMQMLFAILFLLSIMIL